MSLPFTLTDDHLANIALYAADHLPPFGIVFGVPGGGDRLARFFRRHEQKWCTRPLLVDDVWTSGRGMLYYSTRIVLQDDWLGCVIFAYEEGQPLPPNVYSVFRYSI